MATEQERKEAEKENAEREKANFEEWKKLQEDAGFTVSGTSFADAHVVEAPKGPTYDDTPGS